MNGIEVVWQSKRQTTVLTTWHPKKELHRQSQNSVRELTEGLPNTTDRAMLQAGKPEMAADRGVAQGLGVYLGRTSFRNPSVPGESERRVHL